MTRPQVGRRTGQHRRPQVAQPVRRARPSHASSFTPGSLKLQLIQQQNRQFRLRKLFGESPGDSHPRCGCGLAGSFFGLICEPPAPARGPAAGMLRAPRPPSRHQPRPHASFLGCAHSTRRGHRGQREAKRLPVRTHAQASRRSDPAGSTMPRASLQPPPWPARIHCPSSWPGAGRSLFSQHPRAPASGWRVPAAW